MVRQERLGRGTFRRFFLFSGSLLLIGSFWMVTLDDLLRTALSAEPESGVLSTQQTPVLSPGTMSVPESDVIRERDLNSLGFRRDAPRRPLRERRQARRQALAQDGTRQPGVAESSPNAGGRLRDRLRALWEDMRDRIDSPPGEQALGPSPGTMFAQPGTMPPNGLSPSPDTFPNVPPQLPTQAGPGQQPSDDVPASQLPQSSGLVAHPSPAEDTSRLAAGTSQPAQRPDTTPPLQSDAAGPELVMPEASPSNAFNSNDASQQSHPAEAQVGQAPTSNSPSASAMENSANSQTSEAPAAGLPGLFSGVAKLFSGGSTPGNSGNSSSAAAPPGEDPSGNGAAENSGNAKMSPQAQTPVPQKADAAGNSKASPSAGTSSHNPGSKPQTAPQSPKSLAEIRKQILSKQSRSQ